MRLGVGYRKELSEWIFLPTSDLGCIEITAEHFFYGRNRERLYHLKERFPIVVHSLSLSLGTPGKLDQSRLDSLHEIVRITDPNWISEHVSFSRTKTIDLGHLTPIPYTKEYLSIMSDHAMEVSEICQKPILLENITSHIQINSPLKEPEFLNMLCEQSGCSLLLDITNLYVNSKNQGFCPYEWLNIINVDKVRQLHVVGCSKNNGRYFDSHSEDLRTQKELSELISKAIDLVKPEVIILERDNNIPSTGDFGLEFEYIKKICSYEYH